MFCYASSKFEIPSIGDWKFTHPQRTSDGGNDANNEKKNKNCENVSVQVSLYMGSFEWRCAGIQSEFGIFSSVNNNSIDPLSVSQRCSTNQHVIFFQSDCIITISIVRKRSNKTVNLFCGFIFC